MNNCRGLIWKVCLLQDSGIKIFGKVVTNHAGTIMKASPSMNGLVKSCIFRLKDTGKYQFEGGELFIGDRYPDLSDD